MLTFNHDNSYIVKRGKFLSLSQFFLTIILSCLQVPLLCRLLTMTIPILSWNVARSSVLTIYFGTIVMSTSSFTMQSFNHDNSYIVMERGKFLNTMYFLTIIFDKNVYKFLYYAFNHDHSYVDWHSSSELASVP